MRNNAAKQIRGYVTVEITMEEPTRLLNACLRRKIEIWNVRYKKGDTLQFDMFLDHVHDLRMLLRAFKCKTTFKRRSGFPFFLKQMRVRIGLSLGVVLFATMMMLAANMVWDIEIKGASPKVAQELREVVDALGIKRGKFQFLLPPPDEIQLLVTEEVDEATWIGVRKKGTTFEFEVVEQVRQAPAERLSPRHLVASKRAVIHKIFVENGKALKHTNDYVEKGDVIVSGVIGVEGKEKIVAAKATVIGEIWYTSNVTIPLKNTFTTLTGTQKNRRSLMLGGFEVPVWAFTKPAYEQYETFERETDWSLFGYRLPVQFKTTEQRETFSFERTYTEEEAKKVAMAGARTELRERLPEDAVIKSENILQQRVEDGTVSLTIHYQVLEEITQEKPIIQGD
ncbi:sporulation protein YqfD [Shouchella lonarensis]|uniref:Similar to stage IV sporulation protein n=1 Tax=Shouchella lonarensis TaxID=1464122 RepID=A0A1G6KK21_9BACI|nr:sporulation protein YqfD [Shouchella lonarensis]SDC31151.1 similar to stage IV sporulation protein [Shouchella lonarensis]